MGSVKSSETAIGTSLLSALAASVCCITPVLALLGGGGIVATNFTWMEPARPYSIGLSVAALAFAWYQKLKPIKNVDKDCHCDRPNKTSIIQSKFFLVSITILSGLMMAFPLFAQILYPKAGANVIQSSLSTGDRQGNFTIKGMSCKSCETEINIKLSKVPGIVAYTTSYAKGACLVTYDPGKVNPSGITKVINSTGYSVIGFIDVGPARGK